MSNEFVARNGIVIKTITTGTTENKVLIQDDNGLVKVKATADFVTNNCDVWAGTAKVTCIVTLSQSEYDAIGTKDQNTLYIII